MKIIHPYSDNLQVDIKVYAIEEILAEKIRSFFNEQDRGIYMMCGFYGIRLAN